MSTPSYSSSSETRIPSVFLRMNQTMKLAANTQAKIDTMPSSWAPSVASSLVIHTASRPQIPTTPWTEMAPTGSSIRSLSRVTIDTTSSRPPTAPISVAVRGSGVSGSAVMATSPASAPLSAMVRSALPNQRRDSNNANTSPPAAAMFVLTNTSATAFASPTSDTLSSEPPLKPNQPSQRISVPSAASGILQPGMALTCPCGPYLPFRAPSSSTPASAAAAPHMCTTPEPAKSRNPAASSQPAPHFQ